jgi:Mg2+ and Co2+ transporter CorA
MSDKPNMMDVSQLIQDLENADEHINDREQAYAFMTDSVLSRVHELYDLLMELSELDNPEVDAIMEKRGLKL